MITTVARTQDDLGIRGAVAEIGVHRGKLFILLHLLNSPAGRSVAWDLFSRQDENVDNSGQGDQAVFLSNVERWCGSRERVMSLTANSLELSEREVRDALQMPARLFSIDGGHTAEITANDLALAAANLVEGGVVILDDYFNESWPGVSEGLNAFATTRGRKLIPFAIGGNKVFLTNSGYHATRYIEDLTGHRKEMQRHSRFLGHHVIIFRSSTLRRSFRHRARQTRLWQTIQGTRIGSTVRSVVARLPL